jgi:Zn-dependent M28 family amino/carboxypeptidase
MGACIVLFPFTIPAQLNYLGSHVKIRRIAVFAVCLVFVAALSAQEKVPKARPESRFGSHLPPAAIAAMQSIRPENIEQQTRFLSHDLLEGRGTGQRGGDLAAEYIATQFALDGLKPAGENGSYMQKVPMVGITPGADTRFSLVPNSGKPLDLKPLDEYVAYDQTQQAESNIDAEIVYVGYGIEAPEYNWDDYKGVDVKGKVLLMLVNEPPSDDPKFFTGKALTYYGRWIYKYEEAARKGAVGAILIHQTDMASYPWEVVRNSNSGEKSYLKLDGTPKLKAAAWIHLDVARKLAAAAGMDLDKMMTGAQSRDFKPVAMSFRLSAHMTSKVRPFSSNNVIAVLPGSDAQLKDEGVLYTAHYDHFGVRPDIAGDNIFNGAMDNATGCGILLELARVYAQAAQKPRRSIFFSAVTAEEQGLLGSEYLGKHPPIPAGKISLDLNYDNVMPLGAPEQVEVSGAERTTFFGAVLATAGDFRFQIRPDARPEAGHYYRSDHFSLARVGIPAFSVNEGVKFKGHDEAWGLAQNDDYTAHRYHQPSDEYHPGMDWTSDAAMARFGFALGWEAANQTHLVGWRKGDEFERARLASQ